MRRYILGSVLFLLVALACLCVMAAAQEDGGALVLTDDIQPYNGPVGADSPLYGLKLALEDVDESFTANETERVDKQMEHARLRLSEVRRALELNESDSAGQALDNYWLKMNITNATIAAWHSNATGLLHAQEMIVKHQFVLANLLLAHPNNTGLARAYNNSLRLEERFGEKTAIWFNRTIGKDNRTILKAIRLDQKEHDRTGWPGITPVTTIPSTEKLKGYEKDKGMGHEDTTLPVTTVTTTPGGQQQGQGQGHQQDNQGGDRGNAKGNPPGK